MVEAFIRQAASKAVSTRSFETAQTDRRLVSMMSSANEHSNRIGPKNESLHLQSCRGCKDKSTDEYWWAPLESGHFTMS